MTNLTLIKNPMPLQDADLRTRNFDEVALGYTNDLAIAEANRCLECKHKPCVNGCPVSIDIPAFIHEMKTGDFDSAYKVIRHSSALPAICGRVCPQEAQCEKECVRGIKGEPVAIGRLERFVADHKLAQKENRKFTVKPNHHKVAVIGSGPAGLACAGSLAQKGYEVCVFEALHIAGGVLVYGIPEFRLPKEIVNQEIQELVNMGVTFKTNVVIGKTLTIDELFEMGYESVFIGSGAGLPKFMSMEGENLKGVLSANEFLTRVNLMKGYERNSATPLPLSKNVAVIGGGNVAMDAARCAKRLGADNVYIIYRRSEEEMPARLEEIEHAKEEGITFKLLTNPQRIIGDEHGFATAIECINMALGAPDASGRRSPEPIENSDHSIAIDTVIMAIGTSPNPLIKASTEGLLVNRYGGIEVNTATGQTSRPGVFAGGDAVTGAATVILAMGAGKSAASAIDDYIMSQSFSKTNPM